jgi:hypothetical protein
MATLKDTSALQSLNENEYINKLYGNSGDTQKQMLQDHYSQNTGGLNDAQQSVQQQTQTHLNRTDVEAERSANEYANGIGKNMSAGANAQAALSQNLTKQANVTELQNRQKQAEADIERQRQLLGQQYAAAIKQAQADNDMQKAQALYDAAKKEDEQILAYKKKAAEMMASRGDNSLYDALLGTETAPNATETAGATAGEAAQPAATPTWDEVLRNEQSINDIYNAKAESKNQELLMDYQQALSELQAKQAESQRQTDTALNNAYVNNLKKALNYQAVQGAYGQGSGTAAQANVAQDTGLLRELTRLRGLQTGTTAEQGLEGAEIGTAYRDAIAKANADNEAKRITELIGAAEKEEATLAEIQELVGQQYANQNDYSILGKLYGLTQDQIDMIQGTGKYARGSGGGNGKPKPKDNPGATDYKPNLYTSFTVPTSGGIKTSNYKISALKK